MSITIKIYQSYSIRRPLSRCTVPPPLEFGGPFNPKWSEGLTHLTMSWKNNTLVFASKSEKQGAISHASTSAYGEA